MIYCNQTCYEYECPHCLAAIGQRAYFSGADIQTTDLYGSKECVLTKGVEDDGSK